MTVFGKMIQHSPRRLQQNSKILSVFSTSLLFFFSSILVPQKRGPLGFTGCHGACHVLHQCAGAPQVTGPRDGAAAGSQRGHLRG